MYEQQDAILRQATADLLRRAPGHELECPSKLLFQNAREDAAPPDPSFRQVVDEIHGDEELAFAKDFSKYFVLPIAYNVYMPPPPFVSAIRHCGRFSNVPAAAGTATRLRLSRQPLRVLHRRPRIVRQASEVQRVRCAP